MLTVGTRAFIAMLIEMGAIGVFLGILTGFLCQRFLARTTPPRTGLDIIASVVTFGACYLFLELVFVFTGGNISPPLERLASMAPIAALVVPAPVVALMYAIRSRRRRSTAERAR